MTREELKKAIVKEINSNGISAFHGTDPEQSTSQWQIDDVYEDEKGNLTLGLVSRGLDGSKDSAGRYGRTFYDKANQAHSVGDGLE